MQLFTKTPNQWREPTLAAAHVAAYRAALMGSGVRAVVSHDSYLINLASPDPALRARSAQCFVGELHRCLALGIPWVVSLSVGLFVALWSMWTLWRRIRPVEIVA